jgi:hypothetical protein
MGALPPDHRRVAERLRTIILDVDPAFKEAIKWGNPVFSKRKDALYIANQAKYVQLGFFSGATLADPQGLIEGTGKGMRHVKVWEYDEALFVRLRIYIKEAAEQADHP